jgi:nucleoside phosphorylase/tetratricopeptide (TPR) repeat protein
MAKLYTHSAGAGEAPRPSEGNTSTSAQRPVLLLTVNQRETDALRAVFGAAQTPEDFPVGDYPYVRFRPVVDTSGQSQREVIAFRCQMGSVRSGAAQLRVAKAIEHFKPAAVLAVGVGFGLKDSQRLGDVLIANQVATYESARLNDDGSIVYRSEIPPATPAWLQRATQISLNGIQTRTGLVICGEKLVDNADFREQLRKGFPQAIGGDMESFGVATACAEWDEDVKVGWLMIKGVSDLGDGDKNAGGELQADLDQFQAAYRAAMVAHSAVHLRVPEIPTPEHAARVWLQNRSPELAAGLPAGWVQVSHDTLPTGQASRSAPIAKESSTGHGVALPLQLPPAAKTYFGRAAALRVLEQRLRDGQTTAVVGHAGMGKTALAAEALRRVLGLPEQFTPAQQLALGREALPSSAFPDGIVFLDLYTVHGQAKPAWNALADALSAPVADKQDERDRAIAACAGRRLLLVVEGGEEARGGTEADGFARTTRDDLLAPLALEGPVLWLTRDSAQAQPGERIRLDEPLDGHDARALFDNLAFDLSAAAPAVPADVRDRALALLHGHPLAITWAAALMASGDEPAQDFLADLNQQPSLTLHDPRRKHHTLHWLFQRSLRGLGDDARRSLFAAGLLAPEPFPRAAIAQATGLGDNAQRDALKTCVQRNLLRLEAGDGTSAVPHWRFGHALAYGYAREQARADAAVATALLPGLADWIHDALRDGLAPNSPAAAAAQVQRALAHALALLSADAAPGLWRPLVADLLYDLGDRFVALGQLVQSWQARDAVERWLEQACIAQPDDPAWWREVSTCQQRQGDLDVSRGNLPSAQRRYEACRKITERLAVQAPANAERQNDLSISFEKLGDVQHALGDLTDAQSRFEACLSIRACLVAQSSANAERQHSLSIIYNKLGDVQLAQGDLPGAQRRYDASQMIAERLAAEDSANAEWQRNLWVSYNKLGDMKQAQGDLPSAQRRYEAGLVIAERLTAQDPANAQWQCDQGTSYNNLGDVQQAQGDLPGAQRRYEAGLVIRERLATQDPANAHWQQQLSISLERLGGVQRTQGDLPGAQGLYEAGLEIAERLALQDPTNAEWQHDLAISRMKLASVCAARGSAPGTLTHLHAAHATLQALCRRAPDHPQFHRDLALVENMISALQGQ